MPLGLKFFTEATKRLDYLARQTASYVLFFVGASLILLSFLINEGILGSADSRQYSGEDFLVAVLTGGLMIALGAGFSLAVFRTNINYAVKERELADENTKLAIEAAREAGKKGASDAIAQFMKANNIVQGQGQPQTGSNPMYEEIK